MSKEKVVKLSNRGGAREGSGRPKGLTKVKISVSVDEEVFNKASEKWGGKTSPLIERLLRDYLKRQGS